MGKASRKKEKRVQKAVPTDVTTPPLRLRPTALLARPLAVFLILSLLAALIYSNTFYIPFHFDDKSNIADNPTIKNLSNLLDLSERRFVGFLSFALNYHFGGLYLFGYHLVNLIIHIANGFLVYLLILLLFKSPRMLSSPSHQYPTSNIHPLCSWIALSTALLFVAHPIQTQAVTYIVQRFASLATLFYLLTVVCYLKWRLSPSEAKSRSLWYAGALICTVLAMKTKEITFTLPFMLLLVEAVFFGPLTRIRLRQRWVALIPFLLTLPIIPLSHSDALGEAEAGFARDTAEISRVDYLFTQFRVIVTYLRLLVVPVHQNLDYDYPIYHSLLDLPVLFSFLLLLSLFALAVFFVLRSQRTTAKVHGSQFMVHSHFQLAAHYSPLVAFGLLWFFLTLSIESSIIPIRDVIFEHRLYLPSVGFFLVVSVITLGLPHRRMIIGAIAMGVVVAMFSVATYQRNWIWKDEMTLWSDVVRKSPNKARGYNGLGVAYERLGRLEEATQAYQMALTLNPDYAQAHNNLGTLYRDQGRLDEAIREYEAALTLNSDHDTAHNNLGVLYADQGRVEEAIREYEAALTLNPDFAEAHNNLGFVYKDLGRLDEAIREYETALTLNPDFAEAHNNLGSALTQQGKLQEAMAHFSEAVRIKPDDEKAHISLGLILTQQGKLQEAQTHFSQAVRIRPDDEKVHNSLGVAYYKLGQLNDAIREFKTALKLNPQFSEARNNLAIASSDKRDTEGSD